MEPIIECQTINFCTGEKILIFLLPFIIGFISFWLGFLVKVFLMKNTYK